MSKLIEIYDGSEVYSGYVSKNELREFLSILRTRNRDISYLPPNVLYIEYSVHKKDKKSSVVMEYTLPADGIISKPVCYKIIRKLLKRLYAIHKSYGQQNLCPVFDDEIFKSDSFDLVNVLRMDYSWLYKYKRFPQPLVRIASYIPDNLICPINVSDKAERIKLRRFLKTLRLEVPKKSHRYHPQHHEFNSD